MSMQLIDNIIFGLFALLGGTLKLIVMHPVWTLRLVAALILLFVARLLFKIVRAIVR